MDPKQKKQLLIAAGLVVVVGIPLSFVLLGGRGKGETATAQTPRPTTTTIATPAPAQPTTVVAQAPAGQPAAGQPGQTAKPGQPGQPGKPGQPAAKPAPPKPAAPAFRPDPFAPFPKPIDKNAPPPIPFVMQVGPPLVKLQKRSDTVTAHNPLAPVIPAAQQKRLVGVMYDGHAWAIIDVGGISSVVKPGDPIEGGRVQAIGRDSVTIVGDDHKEITLTLSGGGAVTPPVSAEPAPVPLAPDSTAFPLPLPSAL